MRVRLSLLLPLMLVPACARRPDHASLARATGAWYWHNPVALDVAQDEDLRRLGITELYPLAGTFSNDGERLVLRLRREFVPVPANVGVRQIHLVYRFDAGAVRHALDDDPAKDAEAIARAFRDDAAKAEAGEWEVKGVQLDFDCPTRRLARYGEILTALRAKLPRDTMLSVTGLGDWLNGDLAAALRPVDFWCPQLYEFETPRDLAHLTPVSSVGRLDRYRPRLEALGVPYRIGIAAHGQALIYRDGRLDGTAQGLSPSQAARAFPAEPSIVGVRGEERAAYRLDAHRVLLFRRPDPREAQRAIDEENGGAGWDAGCVLFRVAEPDEELTPSLATLAARTRPTDLEVRTDAAEDPFRAIEGGSETVDRALTYTFRSNARSAPPLASDGIEVRLDFAPGSLQSIAPGDFSNLRLVDAQGQGPVSLARASGAVATVPGLWGGRSLRLGPIVKKSGKLRVVARVRGYEGMSTSETEE